MRLIDADRLLNHAIAFFTGCRTSILQFSYVSGMIINAPTVDAVPVVRCKDCAYAQRAKINKKGYRICPASHMEITDDDFCSYGERRDVNG